MGVPVLEKKLLCLGFFRAGLFWNELHRLNGKEYAISPIGVRASWSDASDNCKRENATLATIDSIEENRLLGLYCRDFPSTYVLFSLVSQNC